MNVLHVTNSAWIINGNGATKNELMNKFLLIKIEKYIFSYYKYKIVDYHIIAIITMFLSKILINIILKF